MKNYVLKIKTLSPVHIGTGEVYEPTSYVIGKYTLKNGEKCDSLYEFDDMKFYSLLSQNDKEKFLEISEKTDTKSLLAMQNFIYEKRNLIEKISTKIVRINSVVANEYKEKIGKIVQKEGKNGGKKSVINRLEIEKCFCNPNVKFNSAIIPASSVKGAISTAYQELLVKNGEKFESVKERFCGTSENPFKNLLIADSDTLKSKIYQCVNIGRELPKNGDLQSKLSVNLEAIVSNKECEINLSIKPEILDIKKLIKACNDHYLPIFKTLFSDEGVSESLSEKFYQNYKDFSERNLSENQFLLRVGKHSGARAVTIDGKREISVYHGKSLGYKTEKEETTAWLVKTKDDKIEQNCLPLGWLLCEICEI